MKQGLPRDPTLFVERVARPGVPLSSLPQIMVSFPEGRDTVRAPAEEPAACSERR